VRTELRARQGKVSGSICFWNCVSRGVNSFGEWVDDAASGTVYLIYKRKEAPILQQGTKTTERSPGWRISQCLTCGNSDLILLFLRTWW
jgi:hypothetical protein